MIIHDKLEQGSDEWFRIRQGRPTASGFNRIFTAAKGDLSKSRFEYMVELIAESYIPADDCVENSWLYTGKKFYGNKFTDHGNEMEDEAREAFMKHTGLNAFEVGFVIADDMFTGLSPDSLIGKDVTDVSAGLEMKAKCLKNHLSTLMSNEMPLDHKQQVHGSLAKTGFDEWHFWSYFPGMKPFHQVIKPDDYTKKAADALNTFTEEFKKQRSVF